MADLTHYVLTDDAREPLHVRVFGKSAIRYVTGLLTTDFGEL